MRDFHAFLDRERRRRAELGAAFDLDQAQAAGAHVGQTVEVAERGDVDAVFPRHLEDGLAGAGADVDAVDDQCFDIHGSGHAVTSRASVAAPLPHGADAGRTALVIDVLEVLVAEVAQRAEHRVGRGLPEAAEAGALDHVAQIDRAGPGPPCDAVPSQILVSRSYICAVPARQGMHLPQDSVMQNSMKKRATLTMQEVSSMTIMPPEPMIEPTPMSDS